MAYSSDFDRFMRDQKRFFEMLDTIDGKESLADALIEKMGADGQGDPDAMAALARTLVYDMAREKGLPGDSADDVAKSIADRVYGKALALGRPESS